MKRRQLLTAGGASALALAASQSASAQDADKVYNWKLVMSWPKKYPGLATNMDWLAEHVKKASNGRLNISVYGAGELVPALEVFNAVSEGTAEMGHSASYYWKGKVPECEVFTSVPFGMMADEMTAWMTEGNGLKYLTELYKPFGVRPFLGGNTGAQMGGWFNKEIKSVDDLKGLKIRMPGIAGEVYKMAGASPVTIAGGEIFTSLQSGVIDATDWIGPWNDQAFGLYKVAKYYYNGWQEPGATVELTVNEKAFQSLPADLQEILEQATYALNTKMISDNQKNNALALESLVKKHNVQIKSFPDEVIDIFKKNTQTYLETQYATKSDMAKTIIDDYLSFLDQQVQLSKNMIQIGGYRLRG